MSIMEIAKLVKKVVAEEFPEKGDIPIVTTPTDDNRSYHVNSDKIRRVLGFEPKRTRRGRRSATSARRSATASCRTRMTDDFYFNVRRLKALQAA